MWAILNPWKSLNPYLGLLVRLQTDERADLLRLRVNDAGADKVVEVRVDVRQQLAAQTGQLKNDRIFLDQNSKFQAIELKCDCKKAIKKYLIIVDLKCLP